MQRPGAADGRPPGAEHEVGLARATGAHDRGSVGRVERGVGVAEGDDRGRGGREAGGAGGAEPRRGSLTTTAPRAAAMSADPSVEPLSTTIGR